MAAILHVLFLAGTLFSTFFRLTYCQPVVCTVSECQCPAPGVSWVRLDKILSIPPVLCVRSCVDNTDICPENTTCIHVSEYGLRYCGCLPGFKIDLSHGTCVGSGSPIKTTTSTSNAVSTRTTRVTSISATVATTTTTVSTIGTSVFNSTGTTTAPFLTETTVSLDLTESTTSPALNESTTSPALTESTTSPTLVESTTSPFLNESNTSPNLTKSTATQVLNGSTTSPALTKSITSTALTESTTSSTLAESTTSLVLNESKTSNITEPTTTPVVNNSTTSQALTESTTSTAFTESTTSSTLADSTTTPVLNDSTTSPALTESTTSTARNESTTTSERAMNESRTPLALNESSPLTNLVESTAPPVLNSSVSRAENDSTTPTSPARMETMTQPAPTKPSSPPGPTPMASTGLSPVATLALGLSCTAAFVLLFIIGVCACCPTRKRPRHPQPPSNYPYRAHSRYICYNGSFSTDSRQLGYFAPVGYPGKAVGHRATATSWDSASLFDVPLCYENWPMRATVDSVDQLPGNYKTSRGLGMLRHHVDNDRADGPRIEMEYESEYDIGYELNPRSRLETDEVEDYNCRSILNDNTGFSGDHPQPHYKSGRRYVNI